MKHYADDWLTIYQGDVRAVLPELASDSVDCIVTSPPYWGLRDYSSDGQIGLERTPEEYVANLVAVFRELRRVLKPSGTCWLNLGDSYASSGIQGPNSGLAELADRFAPRKNPRNPNRDDTGEVPRPVKTVPSGLKPKDLVGIPWRVAFALQADGWYLRSDIIWAKPNPMPESVTDRPTKAHEYLFLLTKASRYYFDADAVREAVSPNWKRGAGAPMPELGDHRPTDGARGHQAQRVYDVAKGANLRSVWTIATRPYPGAHFAVFPPELPERCIKAGSSERGVCPECGKPWERVVELGDLVASGPNGLADKPRSSSRRPDAGPLEERPTDGYGDLPRRERTTTGWWPSCEPNHDPRNERHLLQPVPAVVLDPFAGSGTTGMVANRLSRRAILIDLNGDYLKQQLKRNAQTPLGLGA
jgi:DNA modification methylase